MKGDIRRRFHGLVLLLRPVCFGKRTWIPETAVRLKLLKAPPRRHWHHTLVLGKTAGYIKVGERIAGRTPVAASTDRSFGLIKEIVKPRGGVVLHQATLGQGTMDQLRTSLPRSRTLYDRWSGQHAGNKVRVGSGIIARKWARAPGRQENMLSGLCECPISGAMNAIGTQHNQTPNKHQNKQPPAHSSKNKIHWFIRLQGIDSISLSLP